MIDTPTRCPNCSADVTREYCSNCGQRRPERDELTVGHFWRDLVDDITSFQTQFKTVRTLRGLLKPGWLTAEYLAGRRQSLLSPFKTYLMCAAIFFLSAPVAGFTLASMLEADRSGVLRTLVTARAAGRHLDLAVVTARFDTHVQSVYTAALGTAAIVFALVLQVLFRKQRRPFGAQLIFALHYIAFIYLVTVAAGLSRRAGVSIDIAALGGYAVILPYLFLSLKNVYAESGPSIAWKGTILLLVTILTNDLVNFAAIRLTLARV